MANSTYDSRPNGNNSVQSGDAEETQAPWYPVPDSEVVAVEHPYIIKDLMKGIQSLGGQTKLDAVR